MSKAKRRLFRDYDYPKELLHRTKVSSKQAQAKRKAFIHHKPLERINSKFKDKANGSSYSSNLQNDQRVSESVKGIKLFSETKESKKAFITQIEGWESVSDSQETFSEFEMLPEGSSPDQREFKSNDYEKSNDLKRISNMDSKLYNNTKNDSSYVDIDRFSSKPFSIKSTNVRPKHHARKINEISFFKTAKCIERKCSEPECESHNTTKNVKVKTKNKQPKMSQELIKLEECGKLTNRPNDSDCFQSGNMSSGEESDDLTLTKGNIEWLLNYRFHNVFDNSEKTVNLVHHDHNYKLIVNDEFGTDDAQPLILLNVKGGNLKPEATTDLPHTTNDQPASVHYRCGGRTSVSTCPLKPEHTYIELIEQAIEDQGALTVSGIYQWIIDHFPFFKESDDRWKNSVRHNLSINPQFRKVKKKRSGGHLWEVVPNIRRLPREGCNATRRRFHWKKRKLDEFEFRYPHFFEKNNFSNSKACSTKDEIVTSVKKISELDEKHNKENKQSNSIEEEPTVSQSIISCALQKRKTLSESAEMMLYGKPERKVEVEFMTPIHHAYQDGCFLYSCNNYSAPLTEESPSSTFLGWSSFTACVASGQFPTLNPIPMTDVVQESGLLIDTSSQETLACGTLISEFESESEVVDLFDADLLHPWSCDRIVSP